MPEKHKCLSLGDLRRAEMEDYLVWKEFERSVIVK